MNIEPKKPEEEQEIVDQLIHVEGLPGNRKITVLASYYRGEDGYLHLAPTDEAKRV